jgi:hypothetical protein
MAHRRRAGQRDRSRRVTIDVAQPDTPWPHIQALIDNGGNIAIGQIYPIPCAAVASDEHNMYVALLRRDGESLTDLLNRLDTALEAALTQEIYTDEING